jgi:hypothetical protein
VEAIVSPASTIAPQLAGAGVTVHYMAITRRPGTTDLRVARELRALDRKRRFSLVHAHSSKAGALVRMAACGGRKPAFV